MADANRTQWITILEAASANAPEAMNDEWEWLMDELALPFGYFPAVLEALRQGRWRQAKNPKAYLKIVARREAVKLGLKEDVPFELELVSPRTRANGSTVEYEERIEELIYHSGNPGVSQGADGVWRRGGGGTGYEYAEDDRPEWADEFDSTWDYLLSKLPDDLKIEKPLSPEKKAAYDRIIALGDDFHIPMPAPVSPNWKAWAQRAGLDEWERLALECRVSHKSREKALAEQPDDASRKALQAGWKRLGRTGMERLQNALKINLAENVPDDALSDTR